LNQLVRSASFGLKPSGSVVSAVNTRLYSSHGSGDNSPVSPPLSSHMPHEPESPEQFDQRFVDFFNRTDLDGWMVRSGLAELHKHDVVPEPKIVAAALRACRRVNDYSLAIRFLESIKLKCGPKKLQDTIYPYIIQEVRPVLEELGISTPEEMGYDKPELFTPSVDWWEKRYYHEYGYDKNPKYIIH